MTPADVTGQRLGQAGLAQGKRPPASPSARMLTIVEPDRHAAAQRRRHAMPLVPPGPIDESPPRRIAGATKQQSTAAQHEGQRRPGPAPPRQHDHVMSNSSVSIDS